MLAPSGFPWRSSAHQHVGEFRVVVNAPYEDRAPKLFLEPRICHSVMVEAPLQETAKDFFQETAKEF